MAVVIPPIQDDLVVAYDAVLEEAVASVNRALAYPNGSGSRQCESALANVLIALAGEIRAVYSGGAPTNP